MFSAECQHGQPVGLCVHCDNEALRIQISKLERRYAELVETVREMFRAEEDIMEDAQVMPDSYIAAREAVDTLIGGK